MSDIEDEPPPVLLPCSICSRTFRPEVLERHSRVCEKTASKKRRVFDSFKSRVSGTELEEFLGPAPLPGQPTRRPEKSPVKKSAGKPKWKETHEHLIAVLRAARGAANADPATVLAPKNAGNEQCPSCGRFFGPRAFDRHVQFCKEKTSRIKLTPSKVSQAQERLEARTKYKAPLSLKPKLTTKEKYSPMLPRKVESTETCLVTSNNKKPSSINSVNKTTKPLPGKTNLSSFSRQSPTRSSERQRSTSPKKPLVSSSKVVRESPVKPTAQPKIKDSLRDPEDLRPRTSMKMPTHQDKIRHSNRKISDVEDDSPKSVKKVSRRDRGNRRRSCMSSDDGNETDSLNSTGGSTCNSEKSTKRHVKGAASPGSLGIRGVVVVPQKDEPSTPRTSRDGGSRSSTGRGKPRLPMINDLSVNDESFGIHVAPCPQRSSPARRKTSAGQKKSRSRKNTPRERDRKETVRVEEPMMIQPKMTLEVVIPSVPQSRSSRIPKRIGKVAEGRRGSEAALERREDPLEEQEEESRRDRERTAVVKKDKIKWHDISEVSTNDLLHMAEEFDFASEFDDLQLKNDLEAGDSEMEEISRSTLLQLTGEEYLKSDDSAECKPDGTEVVQRGPQEDEFIVLHVAEPEKLADDDMHMKLSMSEPCFNTDYSDRNHALRAIRESGRLFVFESPPKRPKKRMSYRRRHAILSRRVKVRRKVFPIRERTFLANDSPKIKRRKLTENEDPPQTKILNFGDFGQGSAAPANPRSGWNNSADSERTKWSKSEQLETDGTSDLKVKPDLGKFTMKKEVTNTRKQSGGNDKPKSGKKFEYFEIGKDLFEDEQPVEECKNTDTNLEGSLVEVHTDREEEDRGRALKVREKDRGNEPESRKGSGASKMSKPSKEPREEVKKCTICYSDEEFEELRQRKEKGLSQMKPKDPPRGQILSPPAPEPPPGDFGVVDSLCEERLTPIDSLEVVAANSLENITEEEEDQPLDSSERNIEIEDFILKKPNQSKIMSKSGDCLEELFPKPPARMGVTAAESSMAVPLSYVVDSLYDLKDEESVRGRSARKRPEKGMVRLPEIEVAGRKKEKKGKSMSSLVQIWKARREMIENGTLYESRIGSAERSSRTPKTDPFQINSKSKDENYDPFKQAERQMIALLSWPSTADLKSGNETFQSPKSPYQSNRGSNLETSPTSAFSRYPPKEEHSPKENANQRKAQTPTARKSGDYTPVYSAADDWEQIFEKHFDLNRNEMNDKMTRSVKSALDGLLKNSQTSYSTSPEREVSPPRKNRSELSDTSVVEDILYTSTPKRPGSRMSSVADGSLERSPDRRTPAGHRKVSNSHGRATPSEELSDSFAREERGRKSNRNSGVSLSSLSFGSQASDTTIADEEIMRTNLEIIGVGKPTPRTSKRRFARSQSVFDERNKMLFAKAFDSHFSSSDENEMLPTINDLPGKKPAATDPYPKTVPSRFPRSQSVMDGRSRGDGDHFEERDQVSSPEGSKSRKGKMSGDSAYSSLNRRTPRGGVQANQQDERLSSSGSEHSLPPLTNDHALKPVSLNFENVSSSVPSKRGDQPYKMSKFCHECGSKYPVAVAKFCCECGVRRLII